MLWIVVIVLMIVWVLGVTTGYTLSGYVHLLYVFAVAAALARVIMNRHVL